MKKIFIATSNQHKVREFSEMLDGKFSVSCAKSLGGMPPHEETGLTFAENALIKARALKTITPENSYVLADDSGLVVDALNGAPGIYSARYANVKGDNADTENNKKLLLELTGISDEKRTARFVCSIALICPDSSEHIFEETFEGRINHGETGMNGFGYDPLFIVNGYNQTSAEINSELKNTISHRGKALAKLLVFLKEHE